MLKIAEEILLLFNGIIKTVKKKKNMENIYDKVRKN